MSRDQPSPTCACGTKKRRTTDDMCQQCREAWVCGCGKTTYYRLNACRSCYNKLPATRNSNREWFLLKKYNLTLARYFEMLDAQGGTCGNKACAKPAPDPNAPGRRLFHVDHNHECCQGNTSCGKCVRGILCYSCNQLLGNARDDAKILRGAAEYLESVV